MADASGSWLNTSSHIWRLLRVVRFIVICTHTLTFGILSVLIYDVAGKTFCDGILSPPNLDVSGQFSVSFINEESIS